MGARERQELSGLVVGKLTVVGPLRRVPGENQQWLCKCECGVSAKRSGCHLLRGMREGAAMDCGCTQRARAAAKVERSSIAEVSIDLFAESKGACLPLPGPCEFQRCRHWLKDGGCSIKVANEGPHTFETVGHLMGMSKQAVLLTAERLVPRITKKLATFRD